MERTKGFMSEGAATHEGPVEKLGRNSLYQKQVSQYLGARDESDSFVVKTPKGMPPYPDRSLVQDFDASSRPGRSTFGNDGPVDQDEYGWF